MIRKFTFRRLFAGFFVLPSLAFLLGLASHSYLAKELLVCWFLFCSLFALLAVLLLSSVLICNAVHYFLDWMIVAETVLLSWQCALWAFLKKPFQAYESWPLGLFRGLRIRMSLWKQLIPMLVSRPRSQPPAVNEQGVRK